MNVSFVLWLAGEQADATAKRHMFHPFRSLKKKLFGHWWRRPGADTVTVAPSSGHSEASLPVTLTPDVTSDSSTDIIIDVASPNEHATRSASYSIKNQMVRLTEYTVIVCHYKSKA